MISSIAALIIIIGYLSVMFAIAAFVEYKYAQGKNLTNNGFVYSLSLAIYATAWTFYGNIGSAISNSYLFLAIYIGPTIVMLFGWAIIRKLIRIRNEHGITSIAGFMAVRYGKSALVGGIATLIAVIGITPYFALQFRGIFSSFAYITTGTTKDASGYFHLILLATIFLFTIFFGFRRLHQNEKHPGMVMAIAIQSIVKLIAFLTVGIFVTYYMFNGWADIISQARNSQVIVASLTANKPSFSLWISYMVLSMSAILFLPRQFHLAVTENSDEDHIKTAAWVLPLYLILITLFVFPIAIGGLLKGFNVNLAEVFSLVLPFSLKNNFLGILVFLGGFSAAVSMIIVSTVAITTMISNYLLLPIINKITAFNFLNKYLLYLRWCIVAFLLLLGYIFESTIGSSYLLVKIGIISFAAVFQFAPAVIGGLYWKKGSKVGAVWGLIGGFFVWAYTSLFPAIVKSGWLPIEIIEKGPFGISFLNPEHLFGLSNMDPLAVTIIFSLIFNIGFYIIGSLLFEQNEEEKQMTHSFINVMKGEQYILQHYVSDEKTIDLEAKQQMIRSVFKKYLNNDETKKVTNECIEKAKLEDKKIISINDLIELNNIVEKTLSNYIGTPAANAVLTTESLFTEEESHLLAFAYAKLAAEMKITPREFSEKINYYVDKEKFLAAQQKELEEIVKQRTSELGEKMAELEKWQHATLNRELKMIALKEELKKIKTK